MKIITNLILYLLTATTILVSCNKEPQNIPVTGIALDKSSLELVKGETVTLSATVTPSDATNKNYSWASSDASVASVDQAGKVTALKFGTCTISVTTEDGKKTAQCKISVSGISSDNPFGDNTEEEQPSPTKMSGQLKLNITVASPQTATRAVKKDWTVGDRINIWYDANTDFSTEGKPDLIVKYDGSAWIADSEAALSGNVPAESGTMKVIYEASNNWTENYVHDEASSRASFEVSSRGYYTKLMAYAYGCPYSVSDNLLSATISDWTYATPIQIVIAGLDSSKASDYVLSAPLGYTSGITMTADAITTIKGTVNPWEYLPRQVGAPNSDGVAFYFQPTPDTETLDSYSISLYDKVNNVNKSYTLQRTITANVKKCQSFKINESSFELNGCVIDGLTYTFSGGEATLMPGTYYAGGALYTGDINVPASVTVDGASYPVTVIGNSAFSNCRNLNTVTLPEGIVEIGPNAFTATSLQTLVLPASLKEINSANWVFNSSGALTVTVAEGNPYFFIEDKILYRKESETSYTLYHVPEYLTGDIVLSQYTTVLASNGTLYNTKADSVELPAGLKELWGQFRGSIKTGLVVKFNYSTYAEFTSVIGSSLDTRAKYRLGESNMSKIVYSFPSTMSDEDFASLKTWFEGKAKDVVRR